MKAVLMSIQPYWVFLIIAKKMGWNINQEKTIEARKNYPKDGNWNKVAKIYCSKDKMSFAKIPNEYQPLMERLLGKVIGEFVCDRIDRIAHCGTCNNDIRLRVVDENLNYKELDYAYLDKCKLSYSDIDEYSNGGDVYAWHILNLVIYDEPKELSEFYTKCNEGCEDCHFWQSVRVNADEFDMDCASNLYGHIPLKRPPQSWCYVERSETR